MTYRLKTILSSRPHDLPNRFPSDYWLLLPFFLQPFLNPPIPLSPVSTPTFPSYPLIPSHSPAACFSVSTPTSHSLHPRFSSPSQYLFIISSHPHLDLAIALIDSLPLFLPFVTYVSSSCVRISLYLLLYLDFCIFSLLLLIPFDSSFLCLRVLLLSKLKKRQYLNIKKKLFYL